MRSRASASAAIVRPSFRKIGKSSLRDHAISAAKQFLILTCEGLRGASTAPEPPSPAALPSLACPRAARRKPCAAATLPRPRPIEGRYAPYITPTRQPARNAADIDRFDQAAVKFVATPAVNLKVGPVRLALGPPRRPDNDLLINELDEFPRVRNRALTRRRDQGHDATMDQRGLRC